MKTIRLLLAGAALGCLATLPALAQGTAFTYEGRLNDSNGPANGPFDFRFRLTADAAGTINIGVNNLRDDVAITNGLFSVTLDYGTGAFDGSARWLEVAVRPGVSTGAYANLLPRQPVTPTPYAIYAGGASAAGLSGTLPSASLAGTYGGALTFSNGANRFSGIGSNLTALNASQLTNGTVPAAALSNAWRNAGNAGTTPGTHFLGTTDNQPLEFKVNNQRGLRLEYAAVGSDKSVNVIGGYSGNFVESDVVGATIAGGGSTNISGIGSLKNQVTDSFGTVGGGLENTVTRRYATVSGGFGNTASGSGASVGGGVGNAATGDSATVGGGALNAASGTWAMVPGGDRNSATTSAFAAGHRAKANHRGAFVWADSTDADFASTADNQFLIRASGGVAINTTAAHASSPGLLEIESGGANNPALRLSSAGPGHGSGLWLENRSGGDAKTWAIYAGAAGGLHLGYQTAQQDVLYLDTNRYVGIGTSLPATKLHVDGTVTATAFSGNGGSLTGVARLAGGNAFVGDQTITGKVGIGTTTPANQFTVRTPAGGYGIEHTDGVTRMATYIAGGNLGGHLGTISPHSLGFFVNDGPTIMTVHTNGHVGIGTSIPSEKLEVTGNARINGRLNVNSAAADFQSVALVVRMLPGTQAAGSFLDASGNQLVSIYDPVASGLGVALHVLSGNAAKPGGGSWTTLSDVRAKQNIHNLDGALPRLLALRSVTFEFKDPTALGAKAGTQIGFVAQEVEPVFPDWVSTNAKGQKMLSISGFESLTVAALRELQAEQEVQNAKLQEQNRSLEQRVTALEKLINRLSTAQAGAQ